MYDNNLTQNTVNPQRENAERPTRDNQGRFVKGHKPIRRPKYDLIRAHPRLICATCYKGKTCPEYHVRCVCAYKREFDKFFTRDLDSVIDQFCSITNTSMAELQVAMIREVLDGGKLCPQVSRLMDKNMKRLILLYQIYTQIDESNLDPKPVFRR